MQALGLPKQAVVFDDKSSILVDKCCPFWDGHNLDVIICGLYWFILYENSQY